MKKSTFINLVFCAICVMIFAFSVVVTIVWGAWWNLVCGSFAGMLGYALFYDSDYGTESVKNYLAKKLKSK